MRIRTNSANLESLNYYRISYGQLQNTMEKLSSGSRINSAKDDAAGLAISERLMKQIRGNQKSIENLSMGVNLANTAEGGLKNIQDILQRMRELMVQAGNATNSLQDKLSIQEEIDSLREEINHVSRTTEFNGINLLHNTTIEFEDYQEVVVPAGGNQTFNYTVPPKDPEEGTILTVTTTNTLTGKTVNQTMNLDNDNLSHTENFAAPPGYRVKSATVRVISTGDLSDTGEHINLYANGSYYGRNEHHGDNNLFDITNYVKGSTNISLRADKTNTVSDANVQYQLNVVYEEITPTGSTTVTYNHNIGNSTSSSTWNAPAGHVVESATLEINATGDITTPGKEYTVRVNGTNVTQIGPNHGGNTKTIDITSQVQNASSINIQSLDGDDDISFGNAEYKLNVTYRKVMTQTINRNVSFTDLTKSDSFSIPVPQGMRISSAIVTATASGDLNRSSQEYVNLYANGGLIGKLNNSSGLSATFDATSILQGATSLDLEAIKSNYVGYATVNWSVELTYEPTELTLKVQAPNGDRFGDGETYLNGENYNSTNSSTIGAYYSASFPEEKMTFYNPEEGNWATTIVNPSSDHWYKFGVHRIYEKATTISIHNGWRAEGREIIRLANITSETLGIENIHVNDYQSALTKIDTALQMIVDERTRFGKYANVFSNQINHLSTMNITSSTSNARIKDVDMAKEVSSMVKSALQNMLSTQMIDKTSNHSRVVLKLFKE